MQVTTIAKIAYHIVKIDLIYQTIIIVLTRRLLLEYNNSNKLEGGALMQSKTKRITVLTKDKYLYQKILLEARGAALVNDNPIEKSDITLVDIDTVTVDNSNCLTMSRKDIRADVQIPFPLGKIKALIASEKAVLPDLFLSETERCVYLRGERIKLTELEFSLFSYIFNKDGEYASREELLKEIWGSEAESGIINVYVHYLREKLEIHGEKIILSSRKRGYRIDEKYVGEKGE